MTALEALNDLKNKALRDCDFTPYAFDEVTSHTILKACKQMNKETQEEYAILEKELEDYKTLKDGLILGDMSIVDNKKCKALEIIKEKRVDIADLFDTFMFENGLEHYNSYRCDENRKLTQEEYESLKEELL